MEARRERKTRATDRERGREKREQTRKRGGRRQGERKREGKEKDKEREGSEKTRREGQARWGGPQASSRVGERTGPCPSEGLNLKKDVEGKN